MTYFVSDIHGEYDLFIKLLGKIKFSENDEKSVPERERFWYSAMLRLSAVCVLFAIPSFVREGH